MPAGGKPLSELFDFRPVGLDVSRVLAQQTFASLAPALDAFSRSYAQQTFASLAPALDAFTRSYAQQAFASLAPALDAFTRSYAQQAFASLAPALDAFSRISATVQVSSAFAQQLSFSLNTVIEALRQTFPFSPSLLIDANAMRRALQSSTAGAAFPSVVVVDELLAVVDLETEGQLESDNSGLLEAWTEAIRDLRIWLNRPVVSAAAISFALFLVTSWWVLLKAEYPVLADAISEPFWLVVALLAAARAKGSGK